MGIWDGLAHILNFFAPALGVGMIASAGAKLCWWRALKAVAWSRLAFTSSLACGVALLVGMAVFGRDGTIAGYGLMLLACSLSIAWFGFRRAAP